MARFRYSGFSKEGAVESGLLEAETEALALDRLGALGVTVTELDPTVQNQAPPSLGRTPRLSKQAELAEQLSALFSAALPAPQIVDIIASSNSDPTIRRHFHRMSQLMADGMDFREALDAASSSLSPLFSILASIGQAAGKPGGQMPQLAQSLRRQEKLTAQIGGALVYPAILFCGGLSIILMMALFLAPRLEEIFSSVDRPVPITIALFLEMGDWINLFWLPLTALIALIFALVLRVVRRPSLAMRRWLQRLPLIGPVLKEAALARIVRAVQLMLDAGLPLPLALSHAAQTYATEPVSEPFRLATLALEDGAQASTVFTTDPSLPFLFREMFDIGERTNALPRLLSTVAAALEDNVERRLQMLISLMTPVLTLIIGAIIALIVASVMGAILSVNELAF